VIYITDDHLYELNATTAYDVCRIVVHFCLPKQQFPVKIIIGQKQLENVESFKYFGSILTSDGRCTCEIKCKIAMAKAVFNKKRNLFTSTLDLELRKKLVKCYIWSIALYDAETWTLRAVDQKKL
jgi:hypothetical protein